MLTLLLIFLGISDAQARELHESRAKALIHGGYDVSDRMRVETLVIPTPNHNLGLSPRATLGVQWYATERLRLEPYLGWNFSANEPFGSFAVDVRSGPWWGRSVTGYSPMSRAGNQMAQANHKVADWIYLGVITEGLGTWDNASSWNFGVGPQVALRFGALGLDVVAEARMVDGEWGIEPSATMHLFL